MSSQSQGGGEGFPISRTFRRRICIEDARQRPSLLFGGKNLFNSLPRQLFPPGRLKNRMNSSFSLCHLGATHPFLHIILVQFLLFFISSWCKTASAARNLLNSVPQTAATTFASSLSFFLFYHTCSAGAIVPSFRLISVFTSSWL